MDQTVNRKQRTLARKSALWTERSSWITHWREISENQLEESLTMLHDTGYTGCYSIEHHSGQNEYSEVAIQLAKVRDLIGRW